MRPRFVPGLVFLGALALCASAFAESIVATNAVWAVHKGTTEASLPDTAAWRAAGFNDRDWPRLPAPFSYGEPAITNGTAMADMGGLYSTIFLRIEFPVTNTMMVRQLDLVAVCDDGFIAWINGREVARYNAPLDGPRYDSLAATNVVEPVGFGAFRVADPGSVLRDGTNVLCVQVFNVNLSSSDIVFDAGLEGVWNEKDPPVLVAVDPAPSVVTNLTRATVTFSEPVAGVDASDLRVNDIPATNVVADAGSYTFYFAQPEVGPVQFSWDMRSGITDLSEPPNPFDPTGPTSRWLVELADPSAPHVTMVNPAADAVVASLDRVEVIFDRFVEGVTAGELMIGGVPATSVEGVGAGPYVFGFAAAPEGPASLRLGDLRGIHDPVGLKLTVLPYAWTNTLDAATTIPRVIITEFMAENVSGLKDEEGDAEDWIELFNPGSVSVQLGGWSLSDDRENPGQWVFPRVLIGPRQYLVVLASGKDRRVTGTGKRLHTNFKLGVAGEHLGLYAPGYPRPLVAGFSGSYPEQRNDYSYGLDPSGTWRYYAKATPGTVNPASTIQGLCEPVHFSVERGFFQRPFSLILAARDAGAVVRYTLDGSVPTASSGILYTNPVPISTTRMVRAAAFRSNAVPSVVSTHTYLMGQSTTRRLLPALSLVTASNNLYGTSGIMESNPRNTLQHGIAWERPVSAELIRPADNEGFQVDCGLRLQGGGYIRTVLDYRNPTPPIGKYSFRLYFRGDYGPGRLEYPLIPETTVKSFDTLVLRAGMNDPTNPFIRDEFVRRLAADVGQPASRGTFVNLFLDGVYKGYYNPAERVDLDFLRTYHGGTNAWDLVASMSELREGDLVGWMKLQAMAARDLTVVSNYVAMEGMLDTTNFVEYLLPLIYANTDDWPHNNWRAACERSAAGRWRFYIWDAEWSMYSDAASVSHDTIAGQLSNMTPPWGGTEIQGIFTGLRKSPEFRLLFADRVHKHFYNNGALTDAAIKQRYAGLRAEILGSISGFDDTIGTVFIPSRRRYLTNHFAAAGLLASSNAPVFNLFGGPVVQGFTLSMFNGAGSIYYTTNGADPRVRFSGAVGPDAILYNPASPPNLATTTMVRARSLLGTNWSAVTEATFQVSEATPIVRFGELMYHPPGGDAYEYVELTNPGTVAVDLAGYSLEGITYRFVTGASLAPGARWLLASGKNPAAFQTRYPGVRVDGFFQGSLDNGGERLSLKDSKGRVIASVRYGDGLPWPAAADGGGYSLECVDSLGDASSAANWRPSFRAGGSPGEANPAPAASPLRLSEVKAGEPMLGPGMPSAGAAVDGWVEIQNTGTTTLDVSGVRIGSGSSYSLFVAPAGTTLAPGGFAVVLADGSTGGDPSSLHAPFRLAPSDGTLTLYSAAGDVLDAVSYGPQVDGYSLGRTVATGRGWGLCEPTPGGANEQALLAPATNLLLNELLANPVPGGMEGLEIYNRDPVRPASLKGLSILATNALWALQAYSFVGPGRCVWFDTDGTTAVSLPFGLPAAGGVLTVYDDAGRLLDKLSYPAQREGVAYGRYPDGTGAWRATPGSFSPGATNYLVATDPVRLNEVMAWNAGVVTNAAGLCSDWVEIHNPGTNVVKLEGWRLELLGNKPFSCTFTAGTEIAADAYLTVWWQGDGIVPSGGVGNLFWVQHGLPREGGELRLLDAGGQLLSSVRFGNQLSNRSIGWAPGAWKLQSEATPGGSNAGPAVMGNPRVVRINELMPSGAGAAGDWVELFNPDSAPVDVGGWVLTDDMSLVGQTNQPMVGLSFIDARSFGVWLTPGESAPYANRLGFRLSAWGGTLRLYASVNDVIDDVSWGPLPEMASFGRFPNGDDALMVFEGTVSPGASNYRWLTDIVINEVLPNATAPFEPAIEIANLGATNVNLGGCWLTDDPGTPMKYRFPSGTMVPAGRFKTVYASDFEPSFRLPTNGPGSVTLFQVDAGGYWTGYRAAASYPTPETNVSYGRYPTSVGVDFVAQRRPSFGVDQPATVQEFRVGGGGVNVYPRVGPVVMAEVCSRPVRGVNTSLVSWPEDRYLELVNISTNPVPLFAESNPEQTWRLGGAWNYNFPAGVVLAPGERVLIVLFDPWADAVALSAFVDQQWVERGVRLFGPFFEMGSTPGEGIGALALWRPLVVSGDGFAPEALVEKVDFGSGSPWPQGGSNARWSLQRVALAAYGNDPVNWRVAAPNPGLPNDVVVVRDTDHDGLPDDWELANGLDPNSAGGNDGSTGDPDADGLTNLDEFQRGTPPREANSMFRRVEYRADGVHLVINAVARWAYTVEFRETLDAGTWTAWLSLDPVSSPRDIDMLWRPTTANKTRFFRLVCFPAP